MDEKSKEPLSLFKQKNSNVVLKYNTDYTYSSTSSMNVIKIHMYGKMI